MTASKIAQGLLSFLNENPTAWHAIETVFQQLESQGFIHLPETSAWQLKPGGKYYVIRHGRSLCAFILPKKPAVSARIVGSHVDSPGFKLKPHAEFAKDNMVMLGLEIYGAPILASWLNRDLGIAGHVVYRAANGSIKEATIHVEGVSCVIPQIAIHLDRCVNENGLIVHKQEHLAAILACGTKPFKGKLLEAKLKKQLKASDIIASDLRLYPLEPARLIGIDKEMVASYRIDSLASVHAILEGIREIKPLQDALQVVAFWDHEEIGSDSAYGAGSPFLMQTLDRISSTQSTREDFYQMLARSLCLSIDLCHAVHPNYGDRHEPRHPIFMNHGIMSKHNAQYKYAGDAALTALTTELCKKHGIPHQHFVGRGDIPSGSTIGPVLAGLTGIRTLDIGMPQLSMHSSRELMGLHDHAAMVKFVSAFLAM